MNNQNGASLSPLASGLLSPLAILVLCALSNQEGYAKDYFDPSLLAFGMGGNSDRLVDLTAFEQKGGAQPGSYLVDIYLNGQYQDSRNVTFKQHAEKEGLYPLLTPQQLADMGVNVAGLTAFSRLPPTKPFGDLRHFIQQASSRFDLAKLRLDISIPQIALKTTPTGIADPKLWDEGINAFLLNYSLSGANSWQQSAQHNSRQDNLFASFRGGFNVGAWRLRSGGNYQISHSTDTLALNSAQASRGQWTRNDIYLQRNIVALRSELTMGEISTGGNVLDSVSLRGIKLETNNAMTPDNERGFAPIIAGIAKSNAQITIKQNGNIIYQAYVAAGPFRISDIVGGSSQGDLQVTVQEADGSQHSFSQSYSSLPIMQRAGHKEYEVDIGQYRNNGNTIGSRTPLFVQGTLLAGLAHNITLYGGALFAKDYQSAVLGSGFSLGRLGAFSVDTTLSATQFPGEDHHLLGAAFRAKYSKSMLTTGTTVDLTAYRYATRQFYSFADVNSIGYRLNDNSFPWSAERRRSSWLLNLSQSIGNVGNVYLNATRDDYWNSQQVNTSVSAGFSTSIKQLGIGVNYSIDHRRSGDSWPENRTVSVNFSLPLAFLNSRVGGYSPYLTYTTTDNNQGQSRNNLALTGQLSDKWGYSVSQNWGNQGQSDGGGAGLSYQSDIGGGNVNYNYSRGYCNANYGFNGGVLITQYGLTLSPYLGDSAALVRAPGAAGVKVFNGSTATNRWGYAVVPMGGAYRKNTVSIDPTSLPNEVDISQTSVNVYPTQGAIVLANYKTRRGQQLLMNLTYQGKAVPFGALVKLATDQPMDAAIVGDGGQVYLSGMPDQGVLSVQWGLEKYQQCSVHFRLTTLKKANQDHLFTGLPQMGAVCQ